MKAKNKLEHAVFNSWKKADSIQNFKSGSDRLLVGVSGGRDSIVLLKCLTACFPADRLVVVHCHHGKHGNLANYRDRAAKLVELFCTENNLIFELVRTDKILNSEAEFREFRLSSFEAISRKYQIKVVALAHHRDDWLETQLIKLIRGSSFVGLRTNFQWSQLKERRLYLWRPFGLHGRSDLEAYQKLKELVFAEDPSNADSSYLRNWIRNLWLPMLESKRRGSRQRLALSLIHSINEIKSVKTEFPWDFEGQTIDLVYFQSLSVDEKLRCLAFYVSRAGLKSIKSSQLKEIIRQLDKDSDRCHIHFKTFDCLVNAGQLTIRILES